MTPHRPAFIVHTFLPAPPQSRTAAQTALGALWAAVERLGMDAPVGRRSMDLPPLGGPGRDRLDVLAARRRVAPGALYEAVVYRLHDVIGVSVLLAPNDDGIGWGALQQRWTAQVPGPPDATLGTVTVYLGLWAGHGRWWQSGRPGDPATRADRLRPHLPVPDAVDWTGSWCRTADGLLLWELPADEGGPVHRRLLAMGRARDEPTMDGWTWLTDGRVLPPLTRYLLHAEKLRHQERVLEAAMPRLRAAVEGTERACGTLVDLLRAGDPPVGQLLAASRALATVQAGQGGLITSAADAADMAETVRAAHRNMDAALGDGARCQPGGPFDTDRAVVDWLGEQLRIERTYLDSARHRAAGLARLATTVLDDRHRRRQESLTLLQASLLGALLTALAAIQSFDYRVPLPRSLLAPLVCALAVVALLLPAAALHWPRRGSPVPRARWRYVAGAGLSGATLGWLVASGAWRLSAGIPAPPLWSVLAAAGAAVLAAAMVAAVTRRWVRS